MKDLDTDAYGFERDFDIEVHREYMEQKAKAAGRTMKNVTINGEKFQLAEEVVGYRDIVTLAGYTDRPGLTVVFSARRGEWVKDGTLYGAKRVAVEEGMTFHVADTSNA